MAALPLGRRAAWALLGHRLSQLCGVRGEAVGHVHQLQWVIFHQLQMALCGVGGRLGEFSDWQTIPSILR